MRLQRILTLFILLFPVLLLQGVTPLFQPDILLFSKFFSGRCLLQDPLNIFWHLHLGAHHSRVNHQHEQTDSNLLHTVFMG
ncbi:hypothetical protein SDC9_170045 [bioreactor metagenome]|uniref:Uncharacterized protein n=1 Tax=bioreactor metagenome TaxID=1076179 RepID=A0A645G9L0_9ZZZZ